MRDRLYRVQAIILKRTDVGEADRLLTLYSPDRGKLRAVAKGVRKLHSRKSERPLLQDVVAKIE